MAILLQEHSTPKSVPSPKPFIDLERHKLREQDMQLLKVAVDMITLGLEKFGESVSVGLGVRTEGAYAAIYESAQSFAEARALFRELAYRNRDNIELRDIALKAVRRTDRMQEIAIRVERIKRPGISFQIQGV